MSPLTFRNVLQFAEACGEAMSTQIERYLTRRELAEFLTERGFPISKSTLDKLAMPCRNEGPPQVGFWGNRALYDPEKALTWAKRRFRTNRQSAA
jgi:hypothetical protein